MSCLPSQTQSIDKKYLQHFRDDNHFPHKKADFALAFSPIHPAVQKKYAEVRKPGEESPQLSQMNDVYTRTIALYLGAEVKKFGGNEEEARGQLFQWLGAGIMMLRTLIDDNHRTPPPPLLGWVIVGHQWNLFMAVGDGNKSGDDILIFGPIPLCSVTTNNYFGTFKLLRLLERVKEWARRTYWPWFCDAVMKPLRARIDNSNNENQGVSGDTAMG